MSNHATLEARVRAVNRAHAYANELQPLLKSYFNLWVGAKIINDTGELGKKYAKLLPTLPNGNHLSVHRHHSDYSLSWTVKTCEMIEGKESCVYYEIGVYIGTLHNGVLTDITQQPETFRTDYNPEEVATMRQQHDTAKKAASDAQAKLWPFGEYDR